MTETLAPNSSAVRYGVPTTHPFLVELTVEGGPSGNLGQLQCRVHLRIENERITRDQCQRPYGNKARRLHHAVNGG